nr:uncharacterized protein LOC129455952 [Misgurnus anguillicaudatus]
MARGSSFVWTDQEVELLLNVTLDYKTTKLQENIDWETCQSKYADILTLFLEQYPNASSDDFPHQKEDITRTVLTTKLKAVRGKYRGAVDTGRRSGHGRVVLLYFEMCEQVWGGSPASTTLPTGVETNDLEPSSRASLQRSSKLDVIDSSVEVEGHADDGSVAPPVQPVKERRDLLNAKLRGHRQERLNKRLSAEALQQHAVEEDQRIKRQLLNIIEASEKRAADNFSKVSTTLDRLTTSIADGFSFLLETLHTPPVAQAAPPHYTTTLAQQVHVPSQHSYLPNQIHQVFPQNSSGNRTHHHTHNIMPITTNTADLSYIPVEGPGDFSYKKD